jgi:hypothetical protein
MKVYIAPFGFALLMLCMCFYLFLEARPVLDYKKTEEIAIDPDALKYFSVIAEQYASEARSIKDVKN